ncbi:GIY-YIG nuclease family protein [Kitasatospora nipponensis]
MAVYAIGEDNGSGLVKIGRSMDANARARQLQTGSPHQLQVLWQHSTLDPDLEAKLHRHFQDRRLKGEWFDFGHSDWRRALDEAAAELEAIPDAPVMPHQRVSIAPPPRPWRNHHFHDGEPAWSLAGHGMGTRCLCGHKAALHGDDESHSCGNPIPGWGAEVLCECLGFRSTSAWTPAIWTRDAEDCATCAS